MTDLTPVETAAPPPADQPVATPQHSPAGAAVIPDGTDPGRLA